MGDDICLIHDARMMRAREGTKKPFDRIVGRMATVACKSDELSRGGSHPNERKFWASMPVGRLGCDVGNARKLIAELQAEPMKAGLLSRAGFRRAIPR